MARKKDKLFCSLLTHMTLLLCCGTFILSACGKSEQTALQPKEKKVIVHFKPVKSLFHQKKKIKKTRALSPDSSTASPKAKKGKKSFIYKSMGKRDPFISLLTLYEQQKKRRKEKLTRIIHPLQQFRLETLKLVGIFHYSGQALGMVEASDGKAYSVKYGTPIGRNGGKVVYIGKDKITVEETSIDILGRKKVIRKNLKLQQVMR